MTAPNLNQWACFHCGETFTTVGGASDHFGATPDAVAGCLIDRVALEEGGKPERGRGLLMALRKAEAQITQLTAERDRWQAQAFDRGNGMMEAMTEREDAQRTVTEDRHEHMVFNTLARDLWADLIAARAEIKKEREMPMIEGDDLERGFHNRDGWYFRRDSDDGNVRIWQVRWDKAVRLCTSHCPPFRHQTQKTDGVQCDVVDADGNYIYSLCPVLVAGPHIIPENEWASIVASVSRGGETGASWQFVRDFHNAP